MQQASCPDRTGKSRPRENDRERLAVNCWDWPVTNRVPAPFGGALSSETTEPKS